MCLLTVLFLLKCGRYAILILNTICFFVGYSVATHGHKTSSNSLSLTHSQVFKLCMNQITILINTNFNLCDLYVLFGYIYIYKQAAILTPNLTSVEALHDSNPRTE